MRLVILVVLLSIFGVEGWKVFSKLSSINPGKLMIATAAAISLTSPGRAIAVGDPVDQGANSLENTKIRKGGASTLQQGITKR